MQAKGGSIQYPALTIPPHQETPDPSMDSWFGQGVVPARYKTIICTDPALTIPPHQEPPPPPAPSMDSWFRQGAVPARYKTIIGTDSASVWHGEDIPAPVMASQGAVVFTRSITYQSLFWPVLEVAAAPEEPTFPDAWVRQPERGRRPAYPAHAGWYDVDAFHLLDAEALRPEAWQYPTQRRWIPKGRAREGWFTIDPARLLDAEGSHPDAWIYPTQRRYIPRYQMRLGHFTIDAFHLLDAEAVHPEAWQYQTTLRNLSRFPVQNEGVLPPFQEAVAPVLDFFAFYGEQRLHVRDRRQWTETLPPFQEPAAPAAPDFFSVDSPMPARILRSPQGWFSFEFGNQPEASHPEAWIYPQQRGRRPLYPPRVGWFASDPFRMLDAETLRPEAFIFPPQRGRRPLYPPRQGWFTIDPRRLMDGEASHPEAWIFPPQRGRKPFYPVRQGWFATDPFRLLDPEALHPEAWQYGPQRRYIPRRQARLGEFQIDLTGRAEALHPEGWQYPTQPRWPSKRQDRPGFYTIDPFSLLPTVAAPNIGWQLEQVIPRSKARSVFFPWETITFVGGWANSYMAVRNDVVLVSATTGLFTVVLPKANVNNNGVICVKKVDATGNTVRVSPSVGDVIEGAASLNMTVQNDSVMLIADGANNRWVILADVP